MFFIQPLRPHIAQGVAVKEVATKPIDGQKTGTSGLRKKTKVSANPLPNGLAECVMGIGKSRATPACLQLMSC
jgi:phosphoglucomutase